MPRLSASISISPGCYLVAGKLDEGGVVVDAADPATTVVRELLEASSDDTRFLPRRQVVHNELRALTDALQERYVEMNG